MHRMMCALYDLYSNKAHAASVRAIGDMSKDTGLPIEAYRVQRRPENRRLEVMVQ